MQDVLCELNPNRDQTDQPLARLFYAKDIMLLRSKEPSEAALIEIMENPPSDMDIKELIVTRHKESAFNRYDLFFTGKMQLKE